MNKSEIVSKLLERGQLISPKVLDQLTEEKLNSIQNSSALILTSFEEPEITFSVKSCEPKKSTTVKDISDYYNKKYNIIKNILASKINPISINKLPQTKRPVTIIGLVSGKGSFILEDPTGKVEAKFANEVAPLLENSILGFSGELKEKTFLISSIYYPDISLSKQIKKPNFAIKFKKENNNIKVFVNEKEILVPTLPTTVTIKKTIQLNILIFEPIEPMNKNQSIEALKLRYLPEPKIPTENFIISEEPDIFWIVQKDSWTENYKGVVITSGENISI